MNKSAERPSSMCTKPDRTELERSLARAQSSLERQDLQGFCAAVEDLKELVNDENGQWQSAVNFLVRSIHPRSTGYVSSTRPTGSGQ